MAFKDKLKGLKIDPVIETSDAFSRNNVTGFRGVRENIGTTTLLTHVAVELAGQGYSVCIADLDFQSPNSFFSKSDNYTILDKINNTSLNIMNIVNKTSYKNLSYIGARPQEQIATYLPLIVDDKFIEERRNMFSKFFEDLQTKFEVVLVDIPSDLRLAESVFGLQDCKLVFTLSQFDLPCTSKMIKDNMLLTDVVPGDKLYNVVNVSTPMEEGSNYSTIDSRIKLIADIQMSRTVYDDSANRRVERNRVGSNILSGSRDKNEHYYFKGIEEIIDFMKGGDIHVGKVVVPNEQPSTDVVDEPDLQGDA